MISMRKRNSIALAAAVGASVVLAGCSSGGGTASTETKDVTITVALATDPPPQAELDAFTKDTGITVKWTNTDWDSLQTKITAAATAKTYFADATDVDWSRVGQLGKLDWFYPMEDYVDADALKSAMPQLDSFMSNGHVVGVPYDASFMVTTVNTKLFADAGITTMPTTIDEYTADLQQIKAKGVVDYPLSIPFAAAEGLSTYWYQTTAAFGGSILDKDGKPQFSSADSAGYKAAQWMIDGLKNGLVPPDNINASDSEAQQTLMAKGVVATTFADYSGNVGNLYNVPASSTVVDQVQYLPTVGVSGTGPNVSNPDGIGIPRQAKYPDTAAKFIEWFTSEKAQTDFVGGNGPDKIFTNYTLPSRLSVLESVKGTMAGGEQLSTLLADNSQPVFAEGAPIWYPEFSRAVYTNLHAAAVGSMSVADAIKAISDTATKLSDGS